MQANAGGSKVVLRRRSIAGAMALLAAAFSIVLLGSCAQEKAPDTGPELGTCRLPDGRILNDITEARCAELGGDYVPNRQRDSAAVAMLPDGARVDSIPFAAWQPAACGDTSQIDVELAWGAWIEWKTAWIAVDSATARANWDSISYQLAVNGSPVTLPDSPQWRTEPASVTCPDRTLTGTMVSQVVYLPPLLEPRTVTMTYTFNADVNDGWSTYPRGTSATYGARIRPRD